MLNEFSRAELLLGKEAMEKLSGALHDYEIKNRQAPYRVSGMLSANWEHIAVWANA